jgi:hypothetical protein
MYRSHRTQTKYHTAVASESERVPTTDGPPPTEAGDVVKPLGPHGPPTNTIVSTL